MSEKRTFNTPVYTVYKTVNLVNGKFYVGYHKTQDLDDNYLGSGLWLRRSIEKYGWQSFKKEILFVFTSMQEAYEKEREIIALYRNIDPSCMNLHPGGCGGLEIKPEARIRMLEGLRSKKRSLSIEAKLKISKAQKGRERSVKTIEKWRISRTGYKTTEETKEKISIALQGKACTDSAKLRISEANKGRKHTKEYCDNIRQALTGRKLSEEHKQHIRENAINGFKGKHHSPETLEILRQKALERKERQSKKL